MDSPQIAVLAEKVEALRTEVTALRADLKPLAELVTRHDERLTSLDKDRDRGRNWLSALSLAVLGSVLKFWLHL